MSIGYMAEKTVRLILARADDERLKWYADGRVRVRIGMIVPDETGDSQTLADLRKRFRRAVRDRLRRFGWQTAGVNVYAPPSEKLNALQGQGVDVAAICVDGRSCGENDRHGNGMATGVADPVDEEKQPAGGATSMPNHVGK